MGRSTVQLGELVMLGQLRNVGNNMNKVENTKKHIKQSKDIMIEGDHISNIYLLQVLLNRDHWPYALHICRINQ